MKGQLPHPSTTSPNHACVSDFRRREDSEGSWVTRPPPCPKGSCRPNHPAQISALFFFFFFPSSFENLQRNQTVKCSLVAIPGHCSVPPLRRSRKPTAFSLRTCQPLQNIPQRALRERREKKQLTMAHPPSARSQLAALPDTEQIHFFTRE